MSPVINPALNPASKPVLKTLNPVQVLDKNTVQLMACEYDLLVVDKEDLRVTEC
jgi:hypothetical protein